MEETSTLPVHPAATAFRLMTEDELASLAADIKANGLVYPIVRGKWAENGSMVEGIVDGRNRLRACEIAQVEPAFIEYEGDDPRQFIISTNGERRNISLGQKALAYALVYPEPAKLKRGSSEPMIKFQPRISEARTVIEYRPDLVEAIKSGVIALDNAYRQAAERKREQEWMVDGMRQLRSAASELAARVDAGDISFDEARTLLNERERAEREVRATVFQDLRDFVRHGEGFAKGARFHELPQWLEVEAYQTEFRRYFPGGVPELIEKAKSLTAAADAVNQVVAILGKKRRRR